MSVCLACRQPHDGAGLQCATCRTGQTAPAAAAPKPDGRSEATIQAEIVAWLELHGWRVWKTSSHRHAKGVDRGVPDLIAIRDRLAFVEVKKPGGRIRPEQREFRAAAQAAGVVSLVAYGLEDVRQLEAYGTVDRTPQDAQHEPPYPGADTVVMSIRDPDLLVHGKHADCPHEAPHRWDECGAASRPSGDTQEAP